MNPSQEPGQTEGPRPGFFRHRSTLIWLAILLGAFSIIHFTSAGLGRLEVKSLTDFRRDLRGNLVEEVTHSGRELTVKLFREKVPERRAEAYRVEVLPQQAEALSKELQAHNEVLAEKGEPEVDYRLERPSELWLTLIQMIPWLLLFVFIWFIFMRQIRGSAGAGLLSFGRSRARLVNPDRSQVTFEDVAGIKEAKEEVQEIIEFLRAPAKFERLGAKIPRGMLLVGAPGTGKTLLAKAIAGEANRPVFTISGSDFVEMFVGVGASRVRDLFKQAKENAPCIIFLDEIDAVGRRRGTGLGGGHDEREQTLNAILVEMDGFESDTRVIVVAATNRPDVLDPALLRPGRFDRRVFVDLPDLKGRREILELYANKIKLADNVDLEIIARGTPMFSGADLANLVNEAALIAVRKEKDAVDLADLEESRDKVIWGLEKRSRVILEEERKIIAYHESGHAIIAKVLPAAEPLHKVTIIPRGASLGSTLHLPEHDRYLISRKKALAQITSAMAGRVSEEAFCDDITSGARNDFETATELARLMVCKWGMTEALGTVDYSEGEEHLFLGREITRVRNISDHTSEIVDREIRRILEECAAKAKELIQAHREVIEKMVEALLRFEVLSAEDVDALMEGKSVDELPAGRQEAAEEPPATIPVLHPARAKSPAQDKPKTAGRELPAEA